MTYNVFGGTLILAQSINHDISIMTEFLFAPGRVVTINLFCKLFATYRRVVLFIAIQLLSFY